ncbi:uncharacterized protein LOC129616490 [Condylostylus longicornis]|uniref:uncharacterized protein LOC129616490 n=1 Tax=Condylostylus longicornis TaxID=2530218 RepID=UPI00244DE514|nr:uncharacterized protein LOC129616490 [Condylostylus longicornis]
MAECTKCRTKIRGETGIRCAGVCGKIYHSAIKCSGLEQAASNLLDSNRCIKFICDECILYIQNVDIILQNIDCAVKKNNDYLNEYKQEFESAIKKNEQEVIELLRAIEDRYFERLEGIKEAQEKEFEKVSKITEVFKTDSEKLNSIVSSSLLKTDELCKEIKNLNGSEAKMNVGQSFSFADIVKNAEISKKIPKMKKQLPLVIKPVTKQKCNVTRADLSKKVDPKAFKIKNIENRRNGVIIVETDDSQERKKIKSALENNLDEKYEVKIPSEIKPKIEVIHISAKYSEAELKNKLKAQNLHLETSELKIMKMYKIQKQSEDKYNAIIEIDNQSFPRVLQNEKVSIGWERCKVFDALRVLRCCKCNGFNHKAAESKNEENCLNCLGKHKSRDCKKEKVIKCINCFVANDKLKLNLDVGHETLSKECPVYINKLSMLRKKIGY